MTEFSIQPLDPKRFDALAGHARSPAAAYISQELGWFANHDETVLATLLLDTVDGDFAVIILARDEGGRFRCIDLGCSIETEQEALAHMERLMRWHSNVGFIDFTQGDAGEGIDLFNPIIPENKQHPYFVQLNSSEAFYPAKSLINEIMPHFTDVDGNFCEQFQTTGFDARLWELYIHSYLHEEELFMDKQYQSPDFLVTKYAKQVAIEAVTVGRKSDNPPKYFKSKEPLEVIEKADKDIYDSMPIRFGSPLYSKLQKKYWELEHVKNIPLVFAIADFHDDMSMLWSSSSLIFYLYGYRYEHYYDEDKKLVIKPVKIEKHTAGDKEIPSGFFFQPNAENVSAVVTSSIGTISKFNRLGRQAGFKSDNVKMMRVGTYHDHDPNASTPKKFNYIVDETCNEMWAEGLSMYHNPNAANPVPEELFPSIAHHHFRDEQIVSSLPDFHPYESFTINMRTTK